MHINTFAGSVHTIKRNIEVLVVAGKEVVWEVNADETKYLFVSGYQNAGQNHSMTISSFERVEQFRYLVTTIMNQNSIQEEIKI